jgi:hypothetical protein
MLTHTYGVRVCMHEDRDIVRHQHNFLRSGSEYETVVRVRARATVRERVE